MEISKSLILRSTKLVIFTLLSIVCLSSISYASSWSELKKPIPGKPEPIGSYSNGCILGAEAIPLQGKGYQVTRSYKNRYYGDPSLINFIENLAKKVKKEGYPSILIGDMGMPAGGRFTTGHVSHQSGLDVDIFLHFGPATKAQLKAPTPVYMVDYKAENVNSNWTNKQATLIRLAAQDPNVNRIFVNPAIKVKLCETATGDRSWLHKVRPWFPSSSYACALKLSERSNLLSITSTNSSRARLWKYALLLV